MIRHRLVRQSAMNISSGSDSSSTMPSPQPIRRRRNSQDSSSKLFRQLSSESMDNLLSPVSNSSERKAGSGRRHSVACGILYIDGQKPSIKSAFNSAFKKVSSACSVLSSAPSSTFNLSPTSTQKTGEDEVILPQVLGTFREIHMPIPPNCTFQTTRGNVNRRFSTDCPPPSYLDVAGSWKEPAVVTRQKLTRQQEVFASKGSLGALEDDDSANLEDRLVN